MDETVLDLLVGLPDEDAVVALLCDGLRAGAHPRTVQHLLLARPRWAWRGLALDAVRECEAGVEAPLEHRFRRDVVRAHGLPPFALQVRRKLHGWWIRADARCADRSTRMHLLRGQVQGGPVPCAEAPGGDRHQEAPLCRRYRSRMSTLSWHEPAAIDLMLDDLRTWAVVGLSGDTSRTAYRIAELLQQRGKRVVPVHPDAPTVLGEQGYATLADVPFPVDVVDVFRRSEAAGEFADHAVALGAKGIWFQLGVIDEAAFERATASGVPMVMDTCPAIEWGRR